MRNLRYALAAAIIVQTPWSVRAAAITQTFSVTVASATLTGPEPPDGPLLAISGTPFAQFDPAKGRLDEIMRTLAGPAKWTGVGEGVFVLLSYNGEFITSTQFFESPGPLNIDISGTDNALFVLSGLTGTGMTALQLAVGGLSGDMFSTSPAGLQGTITYNYILAAIPEPAVLALLAIGFFGLALIQRRNGL